MKSPKKILFISHRYEPDLGGLSKSATRISRQLAQLGICVHVLVLTRNLPQGIVHLDRDQKPDHPTLYRMGISSRHTTTMMLALQQVRSMHIEHSYTLFWGHYAYPNGFLACLAAREMGVASTVSIRGNDIDTALFSGQAFSHLLWTIESATVLSCVSTQYANRLHGLSDKTINVIVLGNATDTDLFKPVSGNKSNDQITAKNNRPFVVGFSGELREKKGLVPFMHAVEKLSTILPLKVLIVGEVRASDQHLVDRFLEQREDLIPLITFTGHIDDPAIVADHYRKMDVLFQPSLWDGLPNSILEAMACECLVLAGEVGGVTDVIDHGRNGFLLRGADMLHAADALIDIYHLGAEEKITICQEARRTVLNRFSLANERVALKSFLDFL